MSQVYTAFPRSKVDKDIPTIKKGARIEVGSSEGGEQFEHLNIETIHLNIETSNIPSPRFVGSEQ